MQQPAIADLGAFVNSLLIKTRERRRRSDAVKAMTVIKDAKFHAIMTSVPGAVATGSILSPISILTSVETRSLPLPVLTSHLHVATEL